MIASRRSDMASRRHFDMYEHGVEHNEPSQDELPAYEPSTAPLYERVDYTTPLHTYHLRCANRKLQRWVQYGPSGTGLYHVKTYASFRVFSSKPDMAMSQTLPETGQQRHMASISFDNDGPLPWCPRAKFSYAEPEMPVVTVRMESKNFSDWTFAMAGVALVWKFERKPICLTLEEESEHAVIARFTYSKAGTLATNGAEVGKLELYRSGARWEGDVEKILASVMVPITHFKRMGRQYWNAPQLDRSS